MQHGVRSVIGMFRLPLVRFADSESLNMTGVRVLGMGIESRLVQGWKECQNRKM